MQAEPLGAVAVGGRAATVNAWRLLGLGAPAPLEARPPDSAFVGRDAELAELADALARAEREQGVRLVTVTGPAGIGKSRLAREAIAGMGGATVVTARCQSYGEGIAQRPLAELVDQLPGVADEEVERKLLAATGRSDEAIQAEETVWAVRRRFEAVAADRPLVVVLDDAHWAEPPLLDLVDYLVAFSSGAPILLVCLGRPELLAQRPAWAAPQRGASVLALDALPDAEALRAGRDAGRRARHAPGGSSRARRATRCSSSSSWRSAATRCRPRSRPCSPPASRASTPRSARCSSTPRSRGAASTAAPSPGCSAATRSGRR